MAQSTNDSPAPEKTEQQQQPNKDEIQELLETLPTETNWDGQKLVLYQGYWAHTPGLSGVVWSQRHFAAADSDILLATLPKAGTTWLKALGFAILNRNNNPNPDAGGSPVLNKNPHALMPSLEYGLYGKSEYPDLTSIPTPRLLSTHMHATILPKSIWDCNCKIVYICRNPFDLFVSYWHFWLKSMPEEAAACGMDDALDTFLRGVHYHGPFWDHVLGYWNASKKYEKKVLFLKYEELKEDTGKWIKEIAEFVGFPFSEEEVEQGKVEEIAKMCSFDSLKNLEVNRNGQWYPFVKNDAFFRKGQVGDWANHLTPSMVEKISKVVEEKFAGSGLTY